MTTLDDEATRTRYLAAIGGIVVAFQRLEVDLSAFTWMLINTDQSTGQVITAQLSFRNMCDLFGALVHHRYNLDKPATKELTTVIGRLDEAARLRNDYVHSAWFPRTNPDVRHRYKPSAKRATGYSVVLQDVPYAQLQDTIRQIGEIAGEFVEYCKRMDIDRRSLDWSRSG